MRAWGTTVSEFYYELKSKIKNIYIFFFVGVGARVSEFFYKESKKKKKIFIGGGGGGGGLQSAQLAEGEGGLEYVNFFT